jgi:hypothetical protein
MQNPVYADCGIVEREKTVPFLSARHGQEGKGKHQRYDRRVCCGIVDEEIKKTLKGLIANSKIIKSSSNKKQQRLSTSRRKKKMPIE